MGLFPAPLCSPGRGAARGSAVPELGAASGKQREIKARRARRQLEMGVRVPARGCVGVRVSGHMCACTACARAAPMPTSESLELSFPPPQTKQPVSSSGFATQGDPKTPPVSARRSSGAADGEGCEGRSSPGSE